MKLFGSLAAAGLVALALTASASASSCSSNAQTCMKRGGEKSTCFGTAFQACKSSGTYVGPYSGKPFTVTSRN